MYPTDWLIRFCIHLFMVMREHITDHTTVVCWSVCCPSMKVWHRIISYINLWPVPITVMSLVFLYLAIKIYSMPHEDTTFFPFLFFNQKGLKKHLQSQFDCILCFLAHFRQLVSVSVIAWSRWQYCEWHYSSVNSCICVSVHTNDTQTKTVFTN